MLTVVLPLSNSSLSRLYWYHCEKAFRMTLLSEPTSGSDRHSQIYDHRIISISSCAFTLLHYHLHYHRRFGHIIIPIPPLSRLLPPRIFTKLI
ncbi:hypothetical protein K443DRAFT_592579 [Laccaria amethystina LaAM-08-1]|uniref:Uncharacterized protein n=1 Tax=Laccaria amethystina LaAM-08-1 TaxID=1095629 RepID=A0A0C9XT32_9AGAR|nr:hypothetical protein K443DRAFT_592579 [Laccaria amethystina LaAM-08-1]